MFKKIIYSLSYSVITIMVTILFNISVYQIPSAKAQRQTLPYSALIDAIESNKIKQVIINNEATRAWIINPDGQNISVNLPRDPYLIEILIKNNILTSFESPREVCQDSIPEITFTEFITKIENQEIKSIVANNDLTMIKLHTSNDLESKVYISPYNFQLIFDTLANKNILISFEPPINHNNLNIKKNETIAGQQDRENSCSEIALTEFIKMVERNKIKKVFIDTKTTQARAINSINKEFLVNLPLKTKNVTDYVLRHLVEKNVLTTFLPEEKHYKDNSSEITLTEFIKGVDNKKFKSIKVDSSLTQGNIQAFDKSRYQVHLTPNSNLIMDVLLNENIVTSFESPLDKRLDQRNNLPEMSLTKFIQEVKNRKIELVSINKNLTKIIIVKTFEQLEYKVYLPEVAEFDSNSILDILVENNIGISFINQ